MSQEPRGLTRTAVERIVKEEWGRVLATLTGIVRDLEVAEDALQVALMIALQRWPKNGVPDNPRAWLLRTARNKVADRFRRDANFKIKQKQMEVLAELERTAMPEEIDRSIDDERLRLIFTCCHPALAEQARVALTLRTVAGLTTTEIARAFLVPETTMAQRIVRAKRKIKAAGIPYRVPPPHLWPERLDSVFSVIYLVFNEGYAATSGNEPTRAVLCEEAIRLGHILVRLVPDESEAVGLLALMLLHDSRRRARSDNSGDLITLEQQDRKLWNRNQINAGEIHLRHAITLKSAGPYQIQAAISAEHARAESYQSTDWQAVKALYGQLYQLHPTPVVALNRAVALSFADGVEAGLAALSDIKDHNELERYQPYHAARADLLRRAGRIQDAADAYRQALKYTNNSAERRFLEGRLQTMLE
ncbi:MAG: RNA polymerase sigma factor [Rhodospirillales bacterium]